MNFDQKLWEMIKQCCCEGIMGKGESSNGIQQKDKEAKKKIMKYIKIFEFKKNERW